MVVRSSARCPLSVTGRLVTVLLVSVRNMGISEPSSPLWAAVKAVHDSWPQDDETVAADLGVAWQRGGDTVARGGTESGSVGTDVRTAWYDDAGEAFGTRVGEYATAMGKVAAQMKTLEARGAHYASELTATKNSIVSTIGGNEETYAFLGNPIFGELGRTFQNWYATSIANDLKDMVTEKAAALRANPTGAPPPPPPASKKPEDDGWSFSDIGHTVLDVVGLIPVVGEAADGANAVWYAAEGDYLSAALSAAAMIPGAGWAATGAKYGAKYADEAVALVDDAASALTKSGDDVAQLATHTDDVPGAGPSLAGGPSAPTSAVDATPSTTPGGTPDAPTPAGAAGNTPNGTGGPGGTGPDVPSSSRPDNPAGTGTPVDARNCVNDPIDIASGEMVLHQVDLELPGVLPLVLTRTHVSSYRAGVAFGPSWSSTVDQRLEFDAGGVVFVADEGLVLVYPHLAGAEPVLPVHGPRWPLRRTGDRYVVDKPELGQHLEFGTDGAGTRLAAIADRNGNRIDLVRDEHGTPREARHSGGYHVVFDSDRGRIVEMRLLTRSAPIPLPHYRYDGDRLVEVVNSSGLPLRFDYDTDGRITRWEDRNSRWYSYTYDDHGRCVHNDGSDGFLTGRFDYAERRTVFTDSLGADTTFELDEHGRVVRETDPLGNVTVSEWDGLGRLLSRTDPLGRTTSYRYDEDANLVTVVRPDGRRATATYGPGRLPVTRTEPDGAVWRHEYDTNGNVVSIVDPVGARTGFAYGRRGHLVGVTDAAGATTRIVANAAGLPVAVTDPLGATTQYGRDPLGRVNRVVDPLGGVAHLGWTVEGRLLRRTTPDGAVERWRYDGEGNRTEHTDALGATTRTEYTAFDQPSVQVSADGARLELAYDTRLRLTSVTNAQGLVWRYAYDPSGRLVSETDFNGRQITYDHDAAGRLTARTNALGQITTYRRDVLGAVVEQRSGGAVSSFSYDPAGRLTHATNESATVTYRRDPLGRVLAETGAGRTVTSTYDALGRRLTRTTPSGAHSVWEYDANDHPVALHSGGNTIRFCYDIAGREVRRGLGAGAELTQAWDVNHRLVGQTVLGADARQVQQRAYEYRPDGQLAGLHDQLSGPRRFDVDLAGRVTAVHGAGWTERYAYDAAGNVTSAAWPQPSEAHGPREYRGTLITRAGATTFQHDAQGRTVLRRRRTLSGQVRDWHYTWDAEDRLVGVVTPDGAHWRYRYDPLGRRVAKQRLARADGPVVEQVDFTWDGTILAEQTAGIRTTTWDWAPDEYRPVTQVEHELGQDEVDARFHALVTDLVGTPTEMVGPAGELVWHRRASLWGNAAAGQRCPLRFPGQYHDAESGFDYNLSRHYDPETARYGSNDPLDLGGGPNPHAYVANPLRLFDPLGLAPCQIRVSPAAQDWGNKGAHVHVGGNEVRVYPDGRGGIDGEPIRLRNGTATSQEVDRALTEIRSNPQVRADLIEKSRSAMNSMNHGEWGMSSNRAAEMHFLIKALEKMG